MVKIYRDRDDGLAVLKIQAAHNLKKSSLFKQCLRKKVQILFIECNLEIVNCLDFALNLNDGSYHPLQKN